MSLKGSFETIALPEVMALLASSNKSGELRVVGGHLEGRLWLEDGCLVASSVGKAHGHVEALFELLCLTEGNFVFTDGAVSAAPEEPIPVAPVVRQAEERLQEWRDIESIVPSLEHRVRLIPDLPTPEVTLTADEWRLVMAIALAGTVRGALEELSLSHFEGCRGIRRLVDFGLVLVEPPRVRPSASDPARLARRSAPDNGSPVAADGAVRSPRLVRRPAAAHDEPSPVAIPTLSVVASIDDGFSPDDDQGDPDVVFFPLHDDGYDEASYAVAEEEPLAVPWGEPASRPPVSRLASTELGAAVAAAAAAAARAATPVPVPAVKSAPAPAPIPVAAATATERKERPERDSQNDPINRGLLLKFLSSVRS